MTAPPGGSEPERAARLLARWIAAAVAILGTLVTFAHPVGDAPDEAENVQYITLLAEKGRLALPADRVRQSMHPPLAFVVQALATRPLEALVPLLPEEVTWRHWYRVTIPLAAPSQIYMRELGATVRAGPERFHHSTLLGLRLLDVALMTAAALLAAAAARAALPRQPVAAVAAVGFLFLTPQALLQAGAIGMEPLLLVFTSWAAWELARGLRDDLPYSPWRAGAALALAGSTRYAGYACVAAALAVAWARRGRVGTRRAAAELAITAGLGSIGVVAFLAHNVLVGGDPFVFRSLIALFPEMARPLPLSATGADQWVSEMATSFFGISAPGLYPSQTAMVVYLALLAAGLVAALPGGGAAPPRGLRAAAIGATAAVAAIPFYANFHHYQTSGRYLLPAIPFVAPLLGFGFARLFPLRESARRAALLAAVPAAATAIVVTFSLIPHFAPRTRQLRGAVAYADCGGSFDRGRERGTPVRPTVLLPSPEFDYTVDPTEVVYRFAVAEPPERLWLHLLLPGASMGAQVALEPSAWRFADFAYQGVKVSAGRSVLATAITPRARQTVWSYPLPRGCVEGGMLVLRFERAGAAPFVAVAEIRVDATPPPSKEHFGPRIRVCAADASEGRVGERILDLGSQSIYARRAPSRTEGTVCAIPRDLLPPGHYLLRTRVRTEGGNPRDAAGALILGEPGQAFARRKAIDADPTNRDFRSIVQEFDIGDGPPQPVEARVETTGKGDLVVDDIELYGPFELR